MIKRYTIMIVVIGFSCFSFHIEALKRVLWENFQAQAKRYKDEPSKDHVEKLMQAFSILMDASEKEVSQVWKDDASRQMKSFYSATFNPLDNTAAYRDHFEQFYIRNIDKLCRQIPPGVAEKIKDALLVEED